MILFTSEAPTCETCGKVVKWTHPSKRVEGVFKYWVLCDCGLDTITSPFRLCMGGTVEWWKAQGWSLNL